MSENFVVRNFAVQGEDGKDIASNVAVSASADNVYFTIANSERNLNDVLFGNKTISALTNGDDTDFISRIQSLEKKEIKITEVPSNVIKSKYQTDSSSSSVSDSAVLTYQGFKTMRNLEASKCKSNSALAIAEGNGTTAGVKGFKINSNTIVIDEGGKGFIQLLNNNNNPVDVNSLGGSNSYTARYISILLDYCYINYSTWSIDTRREGIIIDNLPQHYINNAKNGNFIGENGKDVEWVNGTVFFTAKTNADQSWFSLDGAASGDVDIGLNARAFGYNNIVLGENSFASGHGNIVYGANSFAMGVDNQVDYCSYADGRGCIARGKYAHAEGRSTVAGTVDTDVAHAEGNKTQALGESSHAEGHSSQAFGTYSHASGEQTLAFGKGSYSEGLGSNLWWKDKLTTLTKEQIINQHITNINEEDYFAAAVGDYSHIEGQYNLTGAIAAHAEGKHCLAKAQYSHAEGRGSKAEGTASHAEGYYTNAEGTASHVEGYSTETKSQYAHAEGYYTMAEGEKAHAEGWLTKASGSSSHAEGHGSYAYGYASHAEGYYTQAGLEDRTGSNVSGYSHAEGERTLAGAYSSHAGGKGVRIGRYAESSFAHGQGLDVWDVNQFAIGKWNKNYVEYANTSHPNGHLVFVIGNGSGSFKDNGEWENESRSNLFEIWSNGKIYVNIEGTMQELVTK